MHLEGFASQYQFTTRPEETSRHGTTVYVVLIYICIYSFC